MVITILVQYPPLLLLLVCLGTFMLSDARPLPLLSDPPSRMAYLQLAAAPSSDLTGLTFDSCTSTECKAPRTCSQVFDALSPCPGEGDCHCIRPDLKECSSHSHCVEGEVCAKVEFYGTVCASEAYVSASSTATELAEENLPPAPLPSGEGLTFDPCKISSCTFPRFCKTVLDEAVLCNEALACHCVPNRLITCTSSNECVAGEACALVPERGEICVSETLAEHMEYIVKPRDPSPEPLDPESTSEEDEEASEGACVAAESLRHLPRKALQFEADINAYVLCDQQDSCATPGHMVEYEGSSMMMSSYCEKTVCERKIMKVNSPRYQRGMRIPSRTPLLAFTVFAARYETLTEEAVLNTVVRLGF